KKISQCQSGCSPVRLPSTPVSSVKSCSSRAARSSSIFSTSISRTSSCRPLSSTAAAPGSPVLLWSDVIDLVLVLGRDVTRPSSVPSCSLEWNPSVHTLRTAPNPNGRPENVSPTVRGPTNLGRYHAGTGGIGAQAGPSRPHPDGPRAHHAFR